MAKPKQNNNETSQMLLFADITRNAIGGFTITPRKPVREVSAAEAARMLNISKRSLSNVVDQPLAQGILVWRWSTEKRGKRIFDLESVLKYREATCDHEFGQEKKTTNGH